MSTSRISIIRRALNIEKTEYLEKTSTILDVKTTSGIGAIRRPREWDKQNTLTMIYNPTLFRLVLRRMRYSK